MKIVNTFIFAVSILLGAATGLTMDSEAHMHNSKDVSTEELKIAYGRKTTKIPAHKRVKRFI